MIFISSYDILLIDDTKHVPEQKLITRKWYPKKYISEIFRCWCWNVSQICDSKMLNKVPRYQWVDEVYKRMFNDVTDLMGISWANVDRYLFAIWRDKTTMGK